jgi:hypothetical protein
MSGNIVRIWGEQIGNVMRTYCELEKNRLGMRENEKKIFLRKKNGGTD